MFIITFFFFFFFNDTATTEIYTLSLHDALPIYAGAVVPGRVPDLERGPLGLPGRLGPAAQRRGRRGRVPVAGEDRRAGQRRRVRLDRGGVLLREVPALGGAAFHPGGQARGRQRRPEHIEEVRRLRRAHLHAVVAGGQV